MTDSTGGGAPHHALKETVEAVVLAHRFCFCISGRLWLEHMQAAAQTHEGSACP